MNKKPSVLPTRRSTHSFMTFIKGMAVGMTIISMIAMYLAVSPRWTALKKAWVNYKHVETLEFNEELTITKK